MRSGPIDQPLDPAVVAAITTATLPVHHPTRRRGDRSMYEPLHLNGTDHLAMDRVAELRSTARELREPAAASADGARARSGLIARTRGTVGRRLISLGTTVAGHSA